MGRLRCLRPELGVLVHVCEREVAEHEAQFGAELRQELPDDRLGLPTVGTLEVTVLDKRDRRGVGPTEVVEPGIDGVGQIHERLRDPCPLRSDHPPGQMLDGPEHEPAEGAGESRGGEDPQLRLLEVLALERDVGDQQGDGEPDPRHRRRPDQGRPGKRPREAPEDAAGGQPRGADDADNLAADQAEDDPERDGGRGGPGERLAADLHPGVARILLTREFPRGAGRT